MKKINFTTIRLLFLGGDVYIKNVLVSKKISFGENSRSLYFNGYLYNGNKVKPLDTMVPKTIDYVTSYDRQTKWMYFLIEDDNLLEKYNTIWDKISTGKEFDGKPVHNNEFLKTKIESHGDEVTGFYEKRFQSWTCYTCLAIITLNSPLKKNGSYYPQVFLKECKYIEIK